MEKTKEEVVKYTKPILKVITTLTPIIITTCQKTWNIYKTLPEDYLQLLIGFIFCFFGGVFPVLFAAVEAAKHGGMSTFVQALGELGDEATKIVDASKKDDDLDEDNDGTKDVEQIDSKALLLRKANLVMTKMDPNKIDKALSSIYKVWLSVVAVLSLQFARTIALSVSISDFIKKPTNRYVSPYLEQAVPEGYEKWVPVVIGWISKSIGMSIAWYLTTIITAVTSALTGALIISRALLKIADNRGITFAGLIPKDHEETYVDEVASYIFAFIGVWFQFKIHFDIPFPANLILWPMEVAEASIRWAITD